jgi:Rrf2 family protein
MYAIILLDIPMMQVSTKTEYGLRCLLSLARQPEGGALTMAEIADGERVPKPYAQQILMKLRRVGLIRSIRGTQGGFALAKPASQISVGAIVRALEGVPFEDTCNHFNKKTDCGHTGACSIRPVWSVISQRLWEALDQIQLTHLLTDEKAVQHKLTVELPVLTMPTIRQVP